MLFGGLLTSGALGADVFRFTPSASGALSFHELLHKMTRVGHESAGAGGSWAWLGGSNAQTVSATTPGSRLWAPIAADDSGALWLFGGALASSSASLQLQVTFFRDLWKITPRGAHLFTLVTQCAAFAVRSCDSTRD